MVVDADSTQDGENEMKQMIQEIIVANACQEYSENVKETLNAINRRLDEALSESHSNMEDLEEKIAARTNYLEKNPDFLSSLSYTTDNIKIESLREFDEIRITLKEHSRRIIEKIEEVENYHQKLYELVVRNSKENLTWRKNLEELEEELFEDCIGKEQLMKILEEETLNEQDPNRPNSEKMPDKDLPSQENQNLTFTQCEYLPTTLEEAEFQDTTDQTDTKEDFKDVEDVQPEDPPNSPEDTECEDNPSQNTASDNIEDQTSTVTDHQEGDTKDLPTDHQQNTTTKPEESPKLEPKKEPSPNFDKSDSFDTVTIQKNAYSDMTLHDKLRENLPDNFQLFPDVVPEVQRRKPVENIHEKLIQQLHASDSLEGFIKLMERKPCNNKNKTNKSNEDLEDKYAGSLWFFSDKGLKKKSSKHLLSTTSSQKNATNKISKDGVTSSTCCNLLVTSSQGPTIPNRERMRKTKSNLEKTKLKYYDLLDDIDGRDLKPIKSEYPRRDNIITQKMKMHQAKSYLHWMLHENEAVWRKLLQPVHGKHDSKRKPKKTKSSKASVESSEHKMKKRSVKNLDSSTSTQQQKTSKNPKSRSVKSLIEYLTSPEQKFLGNRQQTLIVMPVKVLYDNFPTKEMKEEPKTFDGNVKKTIEIPPIGIRASSASPKIAEVSRLVSPLPTKQLDHKVFFKSCPKRTDSGLKKNEDNKTSLPLKKKQEMLQQLKGLKVHNDNIQQNIQKAIDVIETKMIDLLSSSSENNNADAFNVMEEEITKVLEMMNENEKKEKEKAIEQIEAEKDENSGKSLKPKKTNIIVKKTTTPNDTNPPTTTEGPSEPSKNGENHNTADKIKDKPSLEQPKNMEIQNKAEKKDKKETVKMVKVRGEVRRAADIEEGERLLGQVDSVIKKIDSIYNKFYEENEMAQKKENAMAKSGKLSFFTDLNAMVDNTPKGTPRSGMEKIQKPKNDQQPQVSSKIPLDNKLEQKKQIENIKQIEDMIKKLEVTKREETMKQAGKINLNKEETKKPEEKVKREGVVKGEEKNKGQPKKESERKLKEKVGEIKTDEENTVKIKEEIKAAQVVRVMEKPKKSEMERLETLKNKLESIGQQQEITAAVVISKNKKEEEVYEEVNDQVISRYNTLKYIREEMYKRHESILKVFYALFFSSIFFVLNFDYAAL